MKHGQESFIDNQIDDWKNYDGNWVNDRKNFDYNWDVANDLTLSGHCCFGSMRNSGDFSSQDCTFEHKDCYGVLKRPHSWARDTFIEH